MVSVQPRPWPQVPEMTARAAQAAAGKGAYPLAMRLSDPLDDLFLVLRRLQHPSHLLHEIPTTAGRPWEPQRNQRI